MRFLDAQSLLVLLPADSGATLAALDRLTPLFARGSAERLPALVASGFLQTAQINHEGKAVAVVWFRTEFDRLIIDTLCGLPGQRTIDEAFSQIWSGVETLAHSKGCSSVEGVTLRAALARVYQRHGFEARGVLMRRPVTARQNQEACHG